MLNFNAASPDCGFLVEKIIPQLGGVLMFSQFVALHFAL